MMCPTPKKYAYSNQDEAESGIVLVYKTYHFKTPKKNTIPTGTYKCPCGSWHITSKTDNRSPSCKSVCDYILSRKPKEARKVIRKNQRK